jgi:hypothetical protein
MPSRKADPVPDTLEPLILVVRNQRVILDAVEVAHCHLIFTSYRNDRDTPEPVTICDRFPRAPRSSFFGLGPSLNTVP